MSGNGRWWRGRLVLLRNEELAALDVVARDDDWAEELSVRYVDAIHEDEVQAVIYALQLPVDDSPVSDGHAKDVVQVFLHDST